MARLIRQPDTSVEGFYNAAWSQPLDGAIEVRCFAKAWHAAKGPHPPVGATFLDAQGGVRGLGQYVVRRSLDLSDWGDMAARAEYIRRIMEDLERFLPGKAWCNVRNHGRWHSSSSFSKPIASNPGAIADLEGRLEALFDEPDS